MKVHRDKILENAGGECGKYVPCFNVPLRAADLAQVYVIGYLEERDESAISN